MESQFTKKTYSHSQVNLLTKSMLIAAIAFILMGVASYGWSLMFYKFGLEIGTGLLIFFVMLIGGMIISILWMRNMMKSQSMFITMLCFLLYITINSLAFGWLFSLGLGKNDLNYLPLMFVVVGGVFLLALVISKFTTRNGIMTMGKFIFASAMAMMIFMVVFLILMIVAMTTRSEGVVIAGDTLCWVLMAVMCVVSFFYLIIDIWQISKYNEFAIDDGTNQSKILPWFFGYKLLTDLVNVLFYVLILFIRFRGRK